MSYNGSGTFNINTAGQPVVTGTIISSTAFNALTSDLATGLSTAMTKDGQTTATGNIPMGTFKFTGLGAGTSATDSAQYGQLQTGATTIATVTGTDTLTGSLTPAITAYATGNLFSFVAANTNTGAATINLNSLGAKSITKQGATALSAGDIVSNRMYLIEYDGTQFQLINPSTFAVSGIVPTTSGGTGVANGSNNTITFTGNYTFGLTLSANTSLTLPTTGTLGYLNIPQNSQSAAYTTVAADAGKCIFHPSSDANARTFTIDSNANVPYALGTVIQFINMTSQAVTIAITSDTLTWAQGGSSGSRTLAQWGVANCTKVGTTQWLLTGTNVT
jgi:hypothetical protein